MHPWFQAHLYFFEKVLGGQNDGNLAKRHPISQEL